MWSGPTASRGRRDRDRAGRPAIAPGSRPTRRLLRLAALRPRGLGGHRRLHAGRARNFDASAASTSSTAGGYEDFDLCQRLPAPVSARSTRRGRACSPTARRPSAREARTSSTAPCSSTAGTTSWRGGPVLQPGLRPARADYAPAGWRHRVSRGREEGSDASADRLFRPVRRQQRDPVLPLRQRADRDGLAGDDAGRGDPARISAVGEADFGCISHDDLDASCAPAAGPAGDT